MVYCHYQISNMGQGWANTKQLIFSINIILRRVNWFNKVGFVHKIRLILTTARECDIQTVAYYEEKWKLLFDILIKISSSPPTLSIRVTFSISTLFCLLRNSFSCPEGYTYYGASKCQRSLLPYGVIFWSAWTVFALSLGNSNYASTYFL